MSENADAPATFVLYHANCWDGFAAAWAAWLYFKEGAAYIPVSYGTPFPQAVPDGASVYMVDFSYQRSVLEGLLERGIKLVVLDHHKTAQEALSDFPGVTFDLERSGARLAWNHWHPPEMIPRLVEYVEDRDLWRWRLPDSRAVNAWIRSWPMRFDLWVSVAMECENNLPRAVEAGEAILRAEERLVERMADAAREIVLDGHRGHVTNASVLYSDVGHELLLRHGEDEFALTYRTRPDGRREYGIYSRGSGEHSQFDVSLIAKRRGGGGHAGASGWTEDER